LALKKFIPEELNHVINQEYSKFEHIFGLTLGKDLRENVGNEEVCESHCHGLVSFEEGSDEFRDSHLNFFLLLYFFIHDFLLFFIKIFKSFFRASLLLVAVLEEVQHFLGKLLDLVF
jgi:hypothetical protein